MNVVIVGGGTVGSRVAEALADAGESVVVIERSGAVASALRSVLPRDAVVHGNGAEPASLERAHIASADVLAALTDEDEDNLVACLLARREYGVPHTVARVNEERHAWLFGERFGVDVAVRAGDADIEQVIEALRAAPGR